MTLRPLLLCVLCLGLSAGCARPSAPEAPMTENARPPTQPEGISGGTASPEAAQGQPRAYQVRDSGIRCIVPPCPSHLARPVEEPGAEGIPIHEIDFSGLGAPQEKVDEYVLQLTEADGLRVEATLETQPNAGPAGAATVLRVKRVLP